MTLDGETRQYRSLGTWRGLPLVHVAVGGRGPDGRYRPGRARGVVAVGGVAVGVIAVGGVAVGVVSVGAMSVGLVALGALAVAAFAAGAVSVGVWAVGAVSVGVWVIGAVTVGWHASGSLTAAGAARRLRRDGSPPQRQSAGSSVQSGPLTSPMPARSAASTIVYA